jgi:glycosyltransferase involved in cell wall biosynthesis
MTIANLPARIAGIDRIETQVIDDGSTDGTYEVARKLGVNHIIRFKHNKGLAAAFKAGVDHALRQGADILVNTDADNQYCGEDVSRLVEPIVADRADMVVGCRPVDNHPEFSFLKKKLQKLGSWVLRIASKTNVEDAASGFRAYSREAMLHINVFSNFSYCMETLIQAGHNNTRIESVDIRVNPQTRKSRLFKNIVHYIWQSGKTITTIFLLYRSTQFFGAISALLLLVSLTLVARYLILVFSRGAPAGAYWPTLSLSGILFIFAIFMYLTGVITSLIAANRKLSEEILYRLRKIEIDAVAKNDANTERS